ncbi:MAG: hypothetical protein J6S21_02960 [Victivallales bacterium]|nr:hypothetical protein [Victivallales bacterium]
MMCFRLLSIFIFLCAALVFGEVRVRNAGVPGDSSEDGLKRLQVDVQAYSPDAVVIFFGINDSCNPGKFRSVEQYSRNLDAMIDALKSGGCREVVVVSPHPVAEELLLSRSPAVAGRTGGRLLKEYIGDYADAARRCAEGGNAAFVDWHNISAAAVGTGMEATSILRNPINTGASDGVHFTTAGNCLLAQAVWNVLKDKVNDGDLVVCLGDSITASVHVPGAGGVTGESYPAVLWRLLNRQLAMSGGKPSGVKLQVTGGVKLPNLNLEEGDGKGRPAEFPFWEKGRDRFELCREAPAQGAACARLFGAPGSVAVARTQFFPVEGGRSIRVTMQIRGSGTCEIIAGTYEPDRKHSLAKPALTGEWRRFEAEYKIPAGATRSCIIFNCTGTLDFDDIAIQVR